MKWRVLVTRDVELTQSCQVVVECDTPEEAEEKAREVAGANGQADVAWADDDGSVHAGEDGVYIGGPDCVQGIDDKANGE